MPSPFPGMDPYLEVNPIFQELHTQMLAEMQALLQPQLRPRYLARLERHLSEGSFWDIPQGSISLDRKEPDVTIISQSPAPMRSGPATALAQATVSAVEVLDEDELEMRKQRRIVIYVQDRPRLAVTGIELLNPGNKQMGSVLRDRYLEKRASALHGGLHWVEIDLLRGGTRPPIPVAIPKTTDYLSYVAQATPTGWQHLLYAWPIGDPLPMLPIPLLGEDYVRLDLSACFATAYDRVAADEEVNYASSPPPPPLRKRAATWLNQLLRESGLRKTRQPRS